MADASSAADFDRGRRVGKYEILTRLSVGGMAELFLAFTSGPGGFRKFVAVKQILPDVKKDPQFVKMFLDEARITAALSHANIAQVFDLGQEDGELYLAMEFISGQNLERVVKVAQKKQREISLGLAARVVRDTCLGLHCAHNYVDPSGKALPVIHRDVSPKNVMVTYTGDIKVIDFGIAKAKGRLGRTQVGIVKGTSGYMSPEQVRGEPLDGRSDLFAAGVMLHELLSGQRLFQGSNEAAMMLKISEEDAPPLRSLNPKIPAALSDVVAKALARERDARFATGKEMARAIEAAVGAELFDEDQAAAVMRELFEDRMKITRQLLEAATKSEDVNQLDAAADLLRDEPEPSPRPKAKTPAGRRPSQTPLAGRAASVKATPPQGRPESGASRYASKVANDYALYGQSDADTVQDPRPQARRPTDEVRAAGRPKVNQPTPEQAPAQKGGWGGRITLVVFLLIIAGLGASVRVGPLQPVVSPVYDRLAKWVQQEMAGEPPPPPPQPLKRASLPPSAVNLIEKEKLEKAQVEEEKHQAELAAQAPKADPLPADTADKGKSKKGGTGKRTAGQRPDGEAEILDTRTKSGAARDKVGWLSLYSNPPAQVYDGETNLGISPLFKVPLPVGTYHLRLVDPEGKNRALSAPIKPGEVTTLKIQVADLPVQN